MDPYGHHQQIGYDMTRISSGTRRRYVGSAAFQEALVDQLEDRGLDPRLLITAANQKFLMNDVCKLVASQIHLGIEPQALGLPYRASRVLQQAGIKNLADILLCTMEDLKRVKGFGKQSRDQLVSILEALDRTLFIHEDIDFIRGAHDAFDYKYGLFSRVPVTFIYKEWPSDRDGLIAMGINTLDEMLEHGRHARIRASTTNVLSYEGSIIAYKYLNVLEEENQP